MVNDFKNGVKHHYLMNNYFDKQIFKENEFAYIVIYINENNWKYDFWVAIYEIVYCGCLYNRELYVVVWHGLVDTVR